MTNKPTKPVHQAKVFTPEQIQELKRNQELQMQMQKREAFAINILCHLSEGVGIPNLELDGAFITEKQGDHLVNVAVHMADRLLEKLYPVKEDKQ